MENLKNDNPRGLRKKTVAPIDEFIENNNIVIEEYNSEPKVEELPPHIDVTPDIVSPVVKKLGKRTGTIVGCNALRLREGANIKTKEMTVIPANTKVSVDLDNSTDSFYEVTYKVDQVTLIGFCLKEFISLG